MKTIFRQTLAPFLTVAVAVMLLVGAAKGKLELPFAQKAMAKDPSVPVIVDPKPLPREGRFTASFSSVVKQTSPSVVNVFTEKTVKNQAELPSFGDPFFRFFGGEEGEDGGGGSRRAPRTRREKSLGSGVIVSKDGYILTNNHVVDEADEVKVALSTGTKEFAAKVIGKDPRTDLALLKIEASDLPAVSLADSDKLEVGDVVLALGNPFGVGQSVTMGIVSAVGRGGFGMEVYEDFIQTDAAINPGNSGGALVDAEGRLVGINTFILSRTGGNQGIGFAIPMNMARYVMDSLRKEGRVIRGYLGLLPQPVTPELAKEFNVPESQTGALVAQVTEDSAAEKAGLKDGDVITEFNNQTVQDDRRLRLMVAQTPPGTKVPVKILRDGKEKSLTVTLKEYPDEKVAKGRKQSQKPETDSDALDGVTVGDITSAVRRQLGLPRELKGAVITEIDPNSASYEAGLRRGDVIQEIDRKPVQNAEEAVDLSNKVKSKRVLVRVWSNGAGGGAGGSHYLVVDEGKQR